MTGAHRHRQGNFLESSDRQREREVVESISRFTERNVFRRLNSQSRLLDQPHLRQRVQGQRGTLPRKDLESGTRAPLGDQ